jgi:hypothetical protein
MHVLSGQALLRIWEVGQGLHPVDQALTILEIAFAQWSWEELAGLSVGQRDGCLLSVYEETFGQELIGVADCAACQDLLEFSFRVADIRLAPEAPEATSYEFSHHGYQLCFRLPNSFDLAAIAGGRDVKSARRMLLQRCVLEAQHEGQAVSDLPLDVIAALATQMGHYDPQAEVTFDLSCPACGHQWQVLFDIVAFLWPKISERAKRLLRNVHTLARAYGWHEADILSMSAVRRQVYLDMVS